MKFKQKRRLTNRATDSRSCIPEIHGQVEKIVGGLARLRLCLLVLVSTMLVEYGDQIIPSEKCHKTTY